MKKSLFILLALVFVVSLVSCNFGSSSADIVKDASGLEYIYIEKEDSYALHDIGTCTDIEIEIAETINDKPVTAINERAFYKCTSLTSIEIPDSVTSIGGDAFHDCTSLTSIEIPDSVTSIGNYAFYGCASLISVAIGDSVMGICPYAFAYCRSLTSVVIDDSVIGIGNNAFLNCPLLTIYCEAESQPGGWLRAWNISNSPVVWGYTSE